MSTTMRIADHISFLGVDKTYDGRSFVIRDLNLGIRKGEFLTMLGPSGSGKTTTLMMLAGFEMPSSGEIRLAGNPIQNMPAHKRNIGMVFQNYALFPHMTVAENLAYPLKVRKLGRSEIEEKVKRALDMVQMHTMGGRKPTHLSGGQQQRIALARALVFEPEVVLMDEPLGALDKNLREHLQLEIKHIHERLGVTVVYVTHDQSEALTMSDRIAVFNAGRIEQLADPTTLYEEPETAFVAGFIGENNKLPGVIAGHRDMLAEIRIENGQVILARTRQRLDIDTPVVVTIRPECVTLAQGGGTANRLEGQLRDFIYLGDHTKAHMHVANVGTFVAKIPRAMNLSRDAIGTTIGMTWAAEDGIALNL